jgi:hypothetical protein
MIHSDPAVGRATHCGVLPLPVADGQIFLVIFDIILKLRYSRNKYGRGFVLKM